MIATVFIAPHERHEAIDAYRDLLTAEQIDQIEEAPEGAFVACRFASGQPTIIEIEER